MQDRFTLRFQNGEREGDTVGITSPRFTLGRRPGNTVQIQDASVSGEHAEFVADDQGLLLRDLGSTNGTRLSGARIDEGRPTHGEMVTFGSINAVFEDREAPMGMPVTGRVRKAGTVDPPAPGRAAEASAGEGVERISADLVARSGKGSKGALIGALVLLIGGAAAGAYFLMEGGAKTSHKQTPVVDVPGNKLGGYSFEGDGLPEGWQSVDSAPALFSQWGAARVTGADGMRAELAPGEWALMRSDLVNVSTGRQVQLSAKLRGHGVASGRVGVEFMGRDADDGGRGLRAWGSWVADVSNHQDVMFTCAVPPGMSRARVLVEARSAKGGDGASGTVDVDDVSLTDADGSGVATAEVGEYAMWALGMKATSVHLTKISKPLVANFHGTDATARRDFPVEVIGNSTGFELNLGAAEQFAFRVEPEAMDGGLATLGSTGLVERGGDWDAKEVKTLLLGTGHGLVAFEFERPVSVSGRRAGDSANVRVEGAGPRVRVLVNFQKERASAGDLAFAARNAEAAGELGVCLEKWGAILASTPYDAKLVEEARSVRGRLISSGQAELKTVRVSFEQAGFFRLIDLFRQCRSEAEAVGQKYQGCEVESAARELVASIDKSLAGLEEDLSKDEVQRLNSIIHVLERTESPGLAKAVKNYLADEFGNGN